MVSALDSGASGPGSSPGRGHCVVFLGKTLYSHGASLHHAHHACLISGICSLKQSGEFLLPPG